MKLPFASHVDSLYLAFSSKVSSQWRLVWILADKVDYQQRDKMVDVKRRVYLSEFFDDIIIGEQRSDEW